jgi:hypothetical protein
LLLGSWLTIDLAEQTKSLFRQTALSRSGVEPQQSFPLSEAATKSKIARLLPTEPTYSDRASVGQLGGRRGTLIANGVGFLFDRVGFALGGIARGVGFIFQLLVSGVIVRHRLLRLDRVSLLFSGVAYVVSLVFHSVGLLLSGIFLLRIATTQGNGSGRRRQAEGDLFD